MTAVFTERAGYMIPLVYLQRYQQQYFPYQQRASRRSEVRGHSERNPRQHD